MEDSNDFPPMKDEESFNGKGNAEAFTSG